MTDTHLHLLVEQLAASVKRLEQRVDELTAAKSVAAPAGTPAAVRPAAAKSAEIAPEDFAIIAAAVSTLLGKAARIVAVSPADTHGHPPHGFWSIEGRRSIYQSHNVRR